MNKKIYDLALAVGGSHYPDVGRPYLQKFAELLIDNIVVVLKEDRDSMRPINEDITLGHCRCIRLVQTYLDEE